MDKERIQYRHSVLIISISLFVVKIMFILLFSQNFFFWSISQNFLEGSQISNCWAALGDGPIGLRQLFVPLRT